MIDWAQVGTAVAAASAMAAGAWAWWLKQKRDAADTRADVAESRAEENLYGLLSDRLTSLEGDLKSLRAELAVERSHSRKLELHVFRLESLMRAAGLTPPSFEADS